MTRNPLHRTLTAITALIAAAAVLILQRALRILDGLTKTGAGGQAPAPIRRRRIDP